MDVQLQHDVVALAMRYDNSIRSLRDKHQAWWRSDLLISPRGMEISERIEASLAYARNLTSLRSTEGERRTFANALLSLRGMLKEYLEVDRGWKTKDDLNAVNDIYREVIAALEALRRILDRDTKSPPVPEQRPPEIPRKSDLKNVPVTRAKKTSRQPSPSKKKALQGPSSSISASKKKNYWFSRINGSLWQVNRFNTGDSVYFKSHHANTNDGIGGDFENFGKMKVGDEVAVYAFNDPKSLVFIFEVVKELYDHPTQGKIVDLKVTKVFDPPVQRSVVRELLESLGIAVDLDDDENKLFSINERAYRSLYDLTFRGDYVDPEDFLNISSISTDHALVDIPDELDFTSDILALASVISYKDVKPPLAIGLFGNWGTGKSFFMNKLQARIDYLSTLKKNPEFCKEVVQINFNSWHYSDSNLWASLVTKIFEDLEKYGRKKDESKLVTLMKNLNSTQELIVESETKIQKVSGEINELKGKQDKLNVEIRTNAMLLRSLSLKDIVKSVFESKAVQDDVTKLKSEYEFLRINDVESIKENINTLNTQGGRLAEIFKAAYSFRHGKLFIALLAAVVIFGGSIALIHWADRFKTEYQEMKYIIASVAVLLSQLTAFLGPAFKKIDLVHSKLLDLKAKTDELQQRELTKTNLERDELQRKIEAAEQTKIEWKQKLIDLQKQQADARYELTSIASGGKVYRFIESRITDERYLNHLGIISWIRRDFEELDFLLKQQYDARKLKELERMKVENVFEIDRIILYIDDLDRCDASIVVKVLEAINLLLAFPLFVVVVGVDPRWMHNALSTKYKDLFKADVENNEHSFNSTPATSYDYLEKIFQVPFVLKPLNKEGKGNLIDAALRPKPSDEKDNGAAENDHKKNDENGKSNGATSSQKGQYVQSEVRQELINNDNTNSDNGHHASDSGQQQDIGKPDADGDRKKGENQQTDASVNDDKDTKKALEMLKVSDAEVAFMKEISFLIGGSPRTIKRYINIYRIIRTHVQFEPERGNKDEHYFAAMIMLGMITGFPDIARRIFTAVRAADKSTQFEKFLKDFKAACKKNKINIPDTLETYFGGKSLGKTATIVMQKFKDNLELICRFSFRNLG
jgi:hypothetical protein